MPLVEQMTRGYAHLWDECEVTKTTQARAMATRILQHKDDYLKIERDIGVPWVMAAVIHMRESDLDFRTHMHNGDPLTSYTYHVPKGRPKVGHEPPFSFEESTDDAFTMPGKAFDKLKGTFTIELMLFCIEGYNGWGYLDKGNSPYIWSWTNEYHGGKYVSDGKYDPEHWDEQPGCAAIIKALAEVDLSAEAWTNRRASPDDPVPGHVIKQATIKERTAAQAGGAGAAAGTAGTVMPKPDHVGQKVAISFVSGAVLIVGVAVLLVAAILLGRKVQQLKARWTGA